MKVIFITREGYNLSGARIRCYGFARVLSGLGINSEVFSFADNLGAKYGEKEFEMSALRKFGLILRAFKILVKENRQAIFYIQRFNYHAFAPLLVSLIKKNRIILDMDDWDMQEDPKYYLGFYPSSKSEFFTRQIAKRSLFTVAASKYLFEYLKHFNPKVYYLPTGVEIDKFKPNPLIKNSNEIIFSWIGTIYHKEMLENLSFIIDCFSVLARRYANIKLELAAEGRYFNDVKKLVSNLGLVDRVVCYDWIEPDKMPEYLSKIDIGLLPLIQNTKFNLAKSPTKLFEYMAMGKPVIASNVGESFCVIQDGETGFIAGSKEEFMNKMQILIEDENLRKSIGQKAHQEIKEKYSLLTLGRRLCEIFNQTQ